ncbi:MAG: DUF4079 family protein [Spirulina sp. SIO3F2]|nr:DUF4079 family protein [Spirulina sp. SIO3F2]
MDLPSFLWLWRIAAWSMGLTFCTYGLLAITGLGIRGLRQGEPPRSRPAWLRPLHLGLGLSLVGLVVLLLTIGIVGTLGEYGSLGHSWHLGAGLLVVSLVLASAVTGLRHTQTIAGRNRHLQVNGALLVALLLVLGTGWVVVQKYLP